MSIDYKNMSDQEQEIIVHTVHTHFVVPFCDGETATMYFFKDKLLYGTPNQTNITEEQLKSIYLSNEVKDDLSGYTFDQLVAGLMHVDMKADGAHMHHLCYQFTDLAILPIEHAETISILCEALSEQCGGDSSTYSACETFNKMCKQLATKVIPLTTSSVVSDL